MQQKFDPKYLIYPHPDRFSLKSIVITLIHYTTLFYTGFFPAKKSCVKSTMHKFRVHRANQSPLRFSETSGLVIFLKECFVTYQQYSSKKCLFHFSSSILPWHILWNYILIHSLTTFCYLLVAIIWENIHIKKLFKTYNQNVYTF